MKRCGCNNNSAGRRGRDSGALKPIIIAFGAGVLLTLICPTWFFVVLMLAAAAVCGIKYWLS